MGRKKREELEKKALSYLKTMGKDLEKYRDQELTTHAAIAEIRMKAVMEALIYLDIVSKGESAEEYLYRKC